MMLAATMDERLGKWATGCLVLLGLVWLFLALLGIRNTRIVWRIAGGAAFVVGSTLWLGLHPSTAAAWELDSGYLGFAAREAFAVPWAGSPLLLDLIGALLVACSTLGLLVAVDWFGLPVEPMLASLEGRLARAAAARAGARAAAARPDAPQAPLMRSSALLEAPRPARAASAVEAPAPASAPTPVLGVEDAPAVVAAAIGLAARATGPVDAEAAPAAEIPSETVEDEPASEAVSDAASEPVSEASSEPASEPGPAAAALSNWDRFKPRRPTVEDAQEAGESPVVDNEAGATHNTALAEGASRSDAEELDGAAATAAAAPAAQPADEDAPVPEFDLDQDRLAAPHPAGGDETATALAEPEEAGAAAALAPEAPADETLAPRRKKKDDEEEEPASEPGEEGDEEGGEEGDDDVEEDDEEEWEEDDEEEEDEEEEEEGEQDEEWDEEEGEEEEDEEDEEDDDEEWDDEEEEEEEEDDEDDEEEDDASWDDDESSSRERAPIATQEAAEPAATEPQPGRDAASDAPESVAQSPATPSAPAAPAAPPAALPDHLFRGLPADEREQLARAVELILGLEGVSLSKLQRELGITYYAAARVFERLDKEGFIAPYSGSLARTVRLTRAEWDARLRG